MLAGTKLKSLESGLKNILSVSSIGILGLFIWGIGLVSLVFKGIYIFYVIHIISATFIVPGDIPNFIKQNPLIHMSFAPIPTLLIWIGLEWKTRRTKSNIV